MTDRSAVIIAEGFSEAFAQDKATLKFKEKFLIQHVADAVRPIVDEVIVVAPTQRQADMYAALVESDIRFEINISEIKSYLAFALAGFKSSRKKNSILLSSDYPLVSPKVINLLFEISPNKTAVIPRWPNQQIEPLHSVYHTKSALKAGQIAFDEGLVDLDDLIENLGGIRYISTLAIQEFDPELKTFFKIETPLDLKMADTLTKERPWKLNKKMRR